VNQAVDDGSRDDHVVIDRLSWKIKAIVAQEEREKVARRVRDNLRYLRRNGKLLGAIP
jgi:DNA invertase Pin-like site-specific DNA recombinase